MLCRLGLCTEGLSVQADATYFFFVAPFHILGLVLETFALRRL